MDSAAYTTLTRQTGLMREMRIIANNVANAATNGFRQEGLIFSEYIKANPEGESLSMGYGNVRNTSFIQGSLKQTAGTLDFAIEGDGFFLIETPRGERLSRAGAFALNAEGEVVTPDGYRVLDAGGAPLFVPPDAGDLAVSADGTMSANGRLLGQIGLVQPEDRNQMIREDGVMFRVEGEYRPADNSRVLQGFVERSNVDSISAISRIVEVQRAYELGQSFIDAEDRRLRQMVKSAVKS